MLSHLDLLSGLAAIPVWSQYTLFLEHALDFLAKLFSSAGVAVIVFTICIKTALLPLTITSIKSSKAMQELQPKIKELQKKHGKDRQKLSQETMKLYSQYHVNPMAGCLPMIIQIPIFFGLYRAIRHLSQGDAFLGSSQLWSDPFLWLHSLHEPDPYKILPILAGVFQFIQTKMMRPQGQGKSSDPQQAMMNSMMNFMPLMVVIFGWGFASGPVIYWVTQSIYSVVQQWFITGWGSMRDWIPGLPELAEHQRLGYRAPRDLDEVVVISGDGAVQQAGVMGWFNRKMQEAQAQQGAQRGGAAPTEDVIEVSGAPGPKGTRPVKKDSPTARARKTAPRANGANGATNGAAVHATPSTNGATPPVVPRKARPGRPTEDAPE